MAEQPIESPGDEWRSPLPAFEYMNRQHRFVVDLAATDENTLCEDWFTRERSALEARWHEFSGAGWCNPPYSHIDEWLEKAIDEARNGFTSVFLIPTPNGEGRYADSVFGVASEIIFITGRLAFLKPDGTPVSGNTRGSCFVVYRGFDLGSTRISHLYRDHMFNAVASWRREEAAA